MKQEIHVGRGEADEVREKEMKEKNETNINRRWQEMRGGMMGGNQRKKRQTKKVKTKHERSMRNKKKDWSVNNTKWLEMWRWLYEQIWSYTAGFVQLLTCSSPAGHLSDSLGFIKAIKPRWTEVKLNDGRREGREKSSCRM